jgi:flagellar motor switch/type III secretory pathway protein FliN
MSAHDAIVAAEDAANASSAADALHPSEIRLRGVLEVGRVTMSCADIERLVPGGLISLGGPLTPRVRLSFAGDVVAEGELVDADGQLAVEILDVRRPA